jgi:hypothetical protein
VCGPGVVAGRVMLGLPGSDGLFQRIAPPVSCALRPFTTVFGTGTGGTTALQPPGSRLGVFIDCRRSRRTRQSESELRTKALDREHDFAPTLARCPRVASPTGSLPAVLPACCCGRSHLEASFALRCFQRFSQPNVSYPAMPLAGQPAHRRFVHPGPLVLGTAPRKPPTPTTDRDRTVSRRSEPSSRTALMGEQPNPWDLLQPQDATSRHRGAKPCRRCELLGKISLLSPG